MARQTRVGTIGWNHPEWKGIFYPAGAKPDEFLRRYSERFALVEAASSYYGMPRASAIKKWGLDTPDDFNLSLKVPDWIVTKPPDDPDLPRALQTLLRRLEPLGAKLGTLVLQFHPSYRRDKHHADLETLLRILPEGPRWAVELRDASWWRDETYDALREAGVTLVWSDLGGGLRTPPVRTTGALYLRLFGDRELPPPFNKKRRDASATLHEWAERIEHEGAAVDTVDVVVSKFLEGYAAGTALSMIDMLGPDRRARTPKGAHQTTL